jgi:hypothetical protein
VTGSRWLRLSIFVKVGIFIIRVEAPEYLGHFSGKPKHGEQNQ